MTRYLLICCVLGLAASLCAETMDRGPEGSTLVTVKAAGPLDLRGYGRVSAEGRLWRSGRGQDVALVRFTCQDAAAAKVLASKYLADLLAYGATRQVAEPKGLGGTAVEVRHGPVFLLGLSGRKAMAASAPSAGALASAATLWGAATWSAVPANAYPRWLDNFDNAGLGIWWMPTTKTPEEMAWFKDFPAVANLHQQRLDFTPAPGVYDLSGPDSAIAQLRQAGKPYRHMLWCGSGQDGWVNWNLLPGENLETMAPGCTGRRLFEAGGYNAVQVASPAVHALLENSLVEMMRRQGRDPNLLAWMEPHGEFFLSDPAGIPPGWRSRWPAYLQIEKGYTLETISEAYTGDRGAWKTWSDVPYPDTAYFAGRRGSFLDLDATPWRWKPGGPAEGEKAGWAEPGFDDSGWAENFRDDKRVLSQWDNSRVHPLWYRFTQVVAPKYLAGLEGRPVYLHVMPYTEGDGRRLTVWVNGQAVCRDLFNSRDHINRHVQVDVTKALKAGPNQFTIFSNGGRIEYRVFLSDVAGEAFPFSDARLSRRFLDWRDYYVWEKLQTLERFLRAMRSVDPNRPIKVMTPHLFQSEAMALMARYGAYPQLTGEGSWYRPMHYKGYSALRRLPGSSEPGGPRRDARSTQMMFAMIFWESQDCHDYVFDLSRDLWPHKEVVAWWTANKSLLRTIGKTDLGRLDVGVLRDVRQADRYGNSAIWNWDISRGPLPALGLTPVLVDGPEFMAGRADDVPVILDCATVVMEPALVDSVRRYVAGGGIFVAQHHTGRHSLERPNAWPLAEAFGLSIKPKRMTPELYHRWPLGKIRFTKGQSLLPSLSGKEVKGSGVAIDWKENEYTGAVAIRGEGETVRPVALWEDGSMAVADVRYGRGRFILLGTPFYLRFRDVSGKWMNASERQALVEEMLTSLGVERDTWAGDERVWLERRDSKNGLYDVYIGCAMGMRGHDWTLEERIRADLSARRPAPTAAVEATAPGVPDVPTKFAAGRLDFGTQSFSPYQVRQFAVVRERAGLEGPMHWLEVQRRHWRALDPVAASMAADSKTEVAALASELGEAGLDISTGWNMRLDPPDATDAGWVTADVSAWETGRMGSWLSLGHPETQCARYRRRVEIPAAWRKAKARVLLGMAGYWSHGIRDRGRLWVDGKSVGDDLRNMFLFDVSDAASDGALDLALQVEATGLERGPMGTLYLRRVPAPAETLELSTGWTRLVSWEHDGGAIALPLTGKDTVFGLHRKIAVPAAWAGRPVRLVVEYDSPSRHARVEGVIVNRTGYFRDACSAPLGARLDRWFRAGADNDVILLGFGHMGAQYKGFRAKIRSIRLERLP